MVLVEGQAVLPGAHHHLRVGRQLLGAPRDPRPVDPPGVGVGDVELARHRVGGQVVAVGGVVAAHTQGGAEGLYLLLITPLSSALRSPAGAFPTSDGQLFFNNERNNRNDAVRGSGFF